MRDESFSDLTPGERFSWMTADPREYYAAATASARRIVERDAASARRRRAARSRDRVWAPVRWLTHLLGGGRRDR